MTIVQYSQKAFDLIAQFERVSSPDEVMDQLAAALGSFGYESFLVTGLPEPPLRIEPYMLLNGWPVKWAEIYETLNYYEDDPVAVYGRRAINPFSWSEAPCDTERYPRSVEVMNVAADFGMKYGHVVPIVRSTGFHACVTMAGERPDFDPLAHRAIHLIAMMAHGRICTLQGQARNGGKCLTPREREVMTWVAWGKSSWEIARIIGIAERTVNFNIANASQKLNAVNRTQAAVNAVLSGEVEI